MTRTKILTIFFDFKSMNIYQYLRIKTAAPGRAMDDTSLQSNISNAYGGRTADQIREDNSFYNSSDFRDAQGSSLGGKDDWLSKWDKNSGTYGLMENPWMVSDEDREKWKNYEYNRINGIWNNMTSEEQDKYKGKYDARMKALGYGRDNPDMYKTEAGTLPEPVSQPANTEMSLEDYGKQDMANSDNYQAEANNNRSLEEFSNQDIANSNYQNPEANQNDNFQVNDDGSFTLGDNVSEPTSTSSSETTTTGEDDGSYYGNPAYNGQGSGAQRPSYQAMQQNKQELQEWDDHYNAIKQNIMNPSQIRRWEANGFTRDQMEAYADREARKKATNRYGNRPNDIMEEYNYNMNAQASPQQQFDAPPMSREQMMTAQNKPQASSQERLREGNPIYDREVSSLNKQIAKLQQRIQSGKGPFSAARNKYLAQRQLAMLQSNLDGIKALGLASDGSFKGVQRMGKWYLQ